MSQSHGSTVAPGTSRRDHNYNHSNTLSSSSSSGGTRFESQDSTSEALRQQQDSPPYASVRAKDPASSGHNVNGRTSGESKGLNSTSRLHQSNATRFPPALLDTSPADLARVSPKDRLNALLTSSKPASPSSSMRSTPSPNPSQPLPDASAKVPATTTSPHELPSRNVSSPLPRSAQKMSENLQPSTTSGQSTAGLRNASLDSSSSTTSSSVAPPAASMTSSPRPTQDSRASTPQDVTGYIASAGSADAALGKMMAEKQALSTRNDQLWKLVEKQRAMILGLNKDLERAVQDKERYKKKLKDIQAMPPPLPNNAASRSQKDSSVASNGNSKATSHSYKSSDASMSTAGPQSPRLPSEASGAQTARNQNFGLAEGQASTKMPQGQASTTEPRASTDQAVSQAPRPTVVSPKTPTANVVSPTGSTMSSPGEKSRKAVPKPLDLSNARPTMHHRAQASQTTLEDDSGSDYESVLDEVKQSPVDRGRRRTREDDDRFREQLVMDEDEARSASAKDSGKTKTAEVVMPPVPVANAAIMPAGMQAAGGLPASPRAHMLGALQSPLQGNMASIASTLSSKPPPEAKAPVQESVLLPAKSPGLPMSPRPSDRPANTSGPRVQAPPIASPGPMSPKSGMMFSPRPPRGVIPLPGPSPWPQTATGQQGALTNPMMDSDGTKLPPLTEVYRGFVSEQYPNLLLPPNALPFITVKVYSSRLRPSRQSLIMQRGFEDDPGFLLAVNSRADRRQLWRVEKSVSAFTILDRKLRASNTSGIPPLNSSLFSGHSPAQIDARRAALNQYFDVILDSHLSETAAFQVCEFLSTEVLPPQLELDLGRAGADTDATPTSPTIHRRKEGYLSKKGKQFGGWKARYFIIDGTDLQYYEAPGGQHLGYIKLAKAHMAPQMDKESDPEGEFRHAFIIFEPKRKQSDKLVEHILCAESDEERDGWVKAIQQCIGADTTKTQPASGVSEKTKSSHHQQVTPVSADTSSDPRPLQAVSYDATLPAQAPIMVGAEAQTTQPASPDLSPSENSAQFTNHPTISGPLSGGPIQNSSAWGNKASPSLSKDSKKRNVFGFKSRGSEEGTPKGPPSPVHVNEHLNQHLARRQAPVRPVFGMAIAEAAEHCPPFGIDLLLPAPVYRCIEYLQARNAASEEGIFRLSGSNTLIKSLRERFNSQGDVKLLDGNYYDVHAVASLLKLYLRELPDSVLTREHHIEFLRLLEVDDKQTKINSINVLVHRLPEANYELLKTLSHFLDGIVSNSDVNKMNVRNVGIVFSPTLNIPAPLISLFLTDYTAIFLNTVDPSASPVSDASPATPLSYDDFRSPRKQMFTDVSSPSYNQTSFAGFQPVSSVNFQGQDARMQYDTSYVPASHNHAQPQTATFHNAPTLAQVADTGGFGSLNAFLSPTGAPPPAPTPSPGPPPGYQQGPPSLSSSPGSGVSILEQRKSKGDSASALGHTPSTGSNSSANGHVHHASGRSNGSLDGKKKGSSQRLRELAMSNNSMAEVREE